jgi:hypothetical protein
MQDPHDMVKAKLPESESPEVEPHTHCYNAYLCSAIKHEPFNSRGT